MSKTKRFTLSERDKKLLHEVKQIIESHPTDEPLHLQQLCRSAGINEFKLKTGFRMLFSITPCGYFLELKMLRAQQLLLEHDATVNGVAYTLGYQHVSNFCFQFKKKFGATPGEWRRGIEGEGVVTEFAKVWEPDILSTGSGSLSCRQLSAKQK